MLCVSSSRGLTVGFGELPPYSSHDITSHQQFDTRLIPDYTHYVIRLHVRRLRLFNNGFDILLTAHPRFAEGRRRRFWEFSGHDAPTPQAGPPTASCHTRLAVLALGFVRANEKVLEVCTSLRRGTTKKSRSKAPDSEEPQSTRE